MRSNPPPCNSGIIGYKRTLIRPLLFLIVTISGWGVHLSYVGDTRSLDHGSGKLP